MFYVGTVMVYTQHYCAKCGSEQIRRNGSNNGQPKYRCLACRYQALFAAAARKAAQYAQADALLVERNSQRRIVRATGVAQMTIAKRLKKSVGPCLAAAPAAPEKGPKEALGGAQTR